MYQVLFARRCKIETEMPSVLAGKGGFASVAEIIKQPSRRPKHSAMTTSEGHTKRSRSPRGEARDLCQSLNLL